MTKFNKKTRITIGIGLGILFLAVIALSVYQWKQKKFEALDEVEVTDSTEVEEIVYKYGIPTDRYNVKYGIVKPGQTLSVILSEHGLSKKEIHELSQNAEGTFDVRKIKDGQAYAVFTTQDSLATPRYFVYEEDPKSDIVFDLKESHNVSRGKNPVEWRQKEVKGQVESSLWVAMQNNNTSPQLAIVLSHIFGWSAAQAVEKAREQVAQLIGASAKEIVFTSGATECNNIAVKGVAQFYKGKKNHVITTQTVRSLSLLPRSLGAQVRLRQLPLAL